MSVLSWLLDLLYPPKCVLCRKLLTGKGPVCPHCMDKLPEFDGAAPSVRFTSGGTVTDIDFQEETMTIQFDDRTAEYAFDMLSELDPAYAMTVHKCQGSEYRAGLLSLCGGTQMLLTRSVLYTAITRARELLIIVGNEETVAAMTRNDRRQRRYSGLKLRLEGKA